MDFSKFLQYVFTEPEKPKSSGPNYVLVGFILIIDIALLLILCISLMQVWGNPTSRTFTESQYSTELNDEDATSK